MLEGIDMIGLLLSFAFGLCGAGAYAAVGYFDARAKAAKNKKKEPVFSVPAFMGTTVLGGIAGVLLLYFDIHIDVLLNLAAMAGVGAAGTKLLKFLGNSAEVVKENYEAR